MDRRLQTLVLKKGHAKARAPQFPARPLCFCDCTYSPFSSWTMCVPPLTLPSEHPPCSRAHLPEAHPRRQAGSLTPLRPSTADQPIIDIFFQVVNVPSYLVRVDSEKHIDFAVNSPFGIR